MDAKVEIEPSERIVRFAHNFVALFDAYADQPDLFRIYEVHLATSMVGVDSAYHDHPTVTEIDSALKLARNVLRNNTTLPIFENPTA